MTTANAIRFLHNEAAKCRNRDACEALCLLLPALLKVFDLDPMEEVEAAAFRFQFREELHRVSTFQDATDRADARPGFLAQAMQPKAPSATKAPNNVRRAPAGVPEAPGACFEPAPAAS
jgi:hypothetical protein